MKIITTLLILAFICTPLLAQEEESCTVDLKETLHTCIESCKDTCEAQVPECEKQPISLEEIQAAIAEKCNCEEAKNYGKYRSCVAQLIKSLRAFNLIDLDSRVAVKNDNSECKQMIKEKRKEKKNKKEGKGNKGGNS